VNGGADPAPLDRRLARPVVTCDEQNEAVAGVFRPLQRQIDRPPCTVEIVTVKIDDAVRLQRP
jgi:hypothetical protein